MSEVWKKHEGQVVDGKYPLQQLLGSTAHSGVFLTECGDAESGRGAIKIISADFPGAELQLSVWKRAKQLAHPNLLRAMDAGRCRCGEMDVLYIVLEHAEEDLGQVLPERGLNADEAREMLNPLLDALVYLHSKGFVHGHLTPSNVHAIGDHLKISVDEIAPIGEARQVRRERDIYDAPEIESAIGAEAGDLWSLGVTLVEVLTQQAPALPAGNAADPNIPGTLPQPFLEIARNTLRRDPKKRWTTGEVAARLNPMAFAAVAAGSVAGAVTGVAGAISPLSVPLSPERAVPLAKLPATPEKKRRDPQTTGGTDTNILLPNYAIPVLLGAAIVILGIIALPKLLRYRYVTPTTSSAATQPTVTTAAPEKPIEQPVQKASAKSAKAAVPDAPKLATEKKPMGEAEHVTVAEASPTPATLRADTFAPESIAKPAKAVAGRGEVLELVLPNVSEKAQATIQGTIRVGIKVQVSPAGSVSEAALEEAGPSKYFADLALKAARQWEFTSPEAEGRSLPSEWLLRFEFSQTGTKAYATQTQP
jgi:TonB family protein